MIMAKHDKCPVTGEICYFLQIATEALRSGKVFLKRSDIGAVSQRMKSKPLPRIRKSAPREFPGGPLVRIQGFHRHGPGSIPGRELRAASRVAKNKIKKRKSVPEHAERLERASVPPWRKSNL